MNTAKFDIVIYGATSFVGNIMVRHMAETLSDETELRWAIAGRSNSKLEALQKEAKQLSNNRVLPPIIVADAQNEEDLLELCRQTRVVVSTVGPFALYGEALVKACCESGTDYCDITGEIHWVVRMISQYQEAAAASGARIVNCSGFDSIPSDLGVFFTQLQCEEHFGITANEINMRVARLVGEFSGGTYASLVNAVKDLSETPALRKVLVSPYCICPSNHPFKTRQITHKSASFDELSQAWIAPFVMEPVNTRIVHRTNALFDNEYGENFKYDEALVTGKGRPGRKRASRMSFGLKALMLGTAVSPIRALMTRFLLPKPGTGPSLEQQNKGKYDLRFYAKVKGKGSLVCKVTGDRDPGYGSTAKILTQAALCLAFDTPKGEPAGGFWTPARIFSETLIDRLKQHAGLQFTLEEVKKGNNTN